MEASTLQKKKNTISKGKLKKSIKNVLCRPDQLFWPEVTEEEGNKLESALKLHKIKIPVYKKPHWKDVKEIPKDKRPKPPKLKKVNGLLLGIRECSESIQNGECSAVIIESKVNPRLIVQPVVELCTEKEIPLLCLPDLRRISTDNFGIPTACLGLKCNSLLDLRNEIVDIANNYKKLRRQPKQIKSKTEDMDIDVSIDKENSTQLPTFSYLYRKDKKSRVFIPSPTCQEKGSKQIKFVGQDFIEFSDKSEVKSSKTYMKMLLKRISNNPDRVKINK